MKRLGLCVLLGAVVLPVFAQSLVVNGDFEGGFRSVPGGVVANGWQPWDAGTVNPIYPGRTYYWEVPGVPGKAQRIISGQIAGQSFRGGIYQVVEGTIPGVPHVFSFDYLLAGATTDPNAGQQRRIGYDLTGGTNPDSPSIVWVVFEDATGEKPWQHFRTVIVPTGTRVTIWVRAGIYWPIVTTFIDIDNVVLQPLGYSIRGKVTLSDFAGTVSSVPVEAQLRAAGTTNPLRTVVLSLDEAGNYVLPDVQPGNYDLAFKASHWLRQVVRGVQVVNADVSGVDVTLPNGDVDGDNEVSLTDFGNLVAAFGTAAGDDGWNPNADLDGDGEVNLLDFGILVRYFGMMGDD